MQGLIPSVHGNKHRQLHNALSFEDWICSLLHIFLSRAICFAVAWESAIYSRSDIQLLPSSKSKRVMIWEPPNCWWKWQVLYGYSTFSRLWRSLVQSIIIMWPMTDLCWQCQKNSAVIVCYLIAQKRSHPP